MALWIVPTPDQDPDSADLQYKLAATNPLAVFDFGNWDELEAEGTTLVVGTGPTTPLVTASPGGLTVGSPALLGAYRVQVALSGGTPGTTYTVTCTAKTADGITLQGRGQLKVS